MNTRFFDRLSGRLLWATLAMVLLLPLAACGGSDNTYIPLPPGGGIDPFALRDEAIQALLSGDDDFEASEAKLSQAFKLIPTDDATRVFLAKARFLVFLKETATSNDGTLRDLYTRAGLEDIGAGKSFWDLELEEIEHDEGEVMDAAPNADEVRAFLVDDLMPKVAECAELLADTKPDFEYVVDTTMGSRLFDELEPEDRLVYRYDYGDVMAQRTAMLLKLAALSLIVAYDPDGLLPNDFDEEDHPELDALDVIRDEYSEIGRPLDFSRFEAGRGYLEQAWLAYLEASAHIRGETADQAANGLLTLGRDMFASAKERQEFLDGEAEARQMGQAVVDSLRVDAIHTFNIEGLKNLAALRTAATIESDETVQVNLYRLFEGQDLRDLYFKTVVDPFTGKRRFGVNEWGELTNDMATVAGAFLGRNDLPPTAGDLAAVGYMMRMEDPAISAKIIDGKFSDWTASSSSQIEGTLSALRNAEVEIGDAPKDVPDVGRVYASVSGEDLFLFIDMDLTTYTPFKDYGSYAVRVRGPMGHGEVWYDSFGGTHETYSSVPELEPEFAFTPGQGIEIRCPMGAGGDGDWARVTVAVYGLTPEGNFESVRKDMFVKVR